MDVADAATLLGGRFEVRGTLGTGGAGVVYRAFDRQLGREVAVKLLRNAAGRDLLRFKREFRTLADIVHPNLVALHELHAIGGGWFFTMELVEGVSFIDWMRPGRDRSPRRTRQDIREAALDEGRLRAALIQLADALVALHRAGKLHRDLKPSNVLVTDAGRLVLLDFGLIANVAEGDVERLAVGTPVYMSPEQASDRRLSEASDWYGVGAMLYEALTGQRPFEGDSEEVMRRKQVELPVPPGQLVAGIAPDLAKLCMAMLRPTPGARPSGLAILGELGACPSAVTLAMPHRPPATFVGRQRELAMLELAFADVASSGVAVLVRGTSGIGKSTLVRHFLARLGDRAFVLEGRCFEREAVPFKMLDGVVDGLTSAIMSLPEADIERLAPPELGSLIRMFPVLRRVARFSALASQRTEPVDPQELRRRGFAGLRRVIARLARIRPLVMFVDDAHWGDADSASFLSQLMHAGERGVLVIVAHRPEDYLGMVAALRRPPGGAARRGDVREVAVAALDHDEASQLVSQIATDAATTEIAMAAAAGNPLVLVEMARAPALAAGTKIDDLVRERAIRLPLEAQAMLAVSAIAARPLPVAIAAHAAGVVGGLDTATQLSVERLATLRKVGDDMILHPAHDYVRSSILGHLDTEAKAAFHEAIARAFEAVQGEDQLDSQAVVEHWLAAGHPANAAHHAVAAALHAEDAFAFRRAAELYEVALAFGPWDAVGQRDLLRRKAHALVCAGQLDEAVAVYAHAAELLPDAEAIDLERLRVEALLRRGRIDEALPAAEKLLALIGLRIPLGGRTSYTRLATQWVAAKLRGLEYTERDATDVPTGELLMIDVLYSIASGLAFADPGLGRVVQSELIRASLDAGEPIRVCLAMSQEVCYAAAAGSRNRVVVEAVAKRLRAIAVKVARPDVIGFADAAIGIASHMSGRWRDARGFLESGLGTLRDHGAGVRWEIDIGDTFWLATLFYLGEWREMTRHTRLLLRDAIERDDVVAQQNLRIGRCNLAWLLLGQPDEAREHLAIAQRSLGGGFHLQNVSVLTAAVAIDLYMREPAAALDRLDEAWSQIERIGVLRLQQPRVELAVLRARALLAARGRGPERLREVRGIADDLIKEGAPWATALGFLVRAATHAWATGDPRTDSARADLLTAEEHLGTTGMLGHLQLARMHRGRIEGGLAGDARAAAAREFLGELGAAQPEGLAYLLMPWPS